MTSKEFIEDCILNLECKYFDELKNVIFSENFIPFYFIPLEEITPIIFAEKLYDYFEKVEIKSGKSFDKRIESFYQGMDSIVGPYIDKETKHKENKEVIHYLPRSRKYYEKAKEITKKEQTISNLLDFSRVMFCLYSAIIKNEHKSIENFNFALESIDLKIMIDSLKKEQSSTPLGKKNRFDIEKLYESDKCTFIIMIIIYYLIKNNDIFEE